jgi:PAS domain-containing protein
MVDSLEESYIELNETNKNMELAVEQRTKQLRGQVEVRAKAEEKLKATNKMVSSIINTSPLPIVTLAVDFRVKTASPAFKQIFLYEEYEILEKILPFIYMSDTEYFAHILQKLRDPNKSERVTVKGRKNIASIFIQIVVPRSCGCS